jgi:hypothetical protein
VTKLYRDDRPGVLEKCDTSVACTSLSAERWPGHRGPSHRGPYEEAREINFLIEMRSRGLPGELAKVPNQVSLIVIAATGCSVDPSAILNTP